MLQASMHINSNLILIPPRLVLASPGAVRLTSSKIGTRRQGNSARRGGGKRHGIDETGTSSDGALCLRHGAGSVTAAGPTSELAASRNVYLGIGRSGSVVNFERIPEHDALRDSVRSFFDRQLQEPKIREMDRARRIPRELWKRRRRMMKR
ncbi:acyl-CoA dehydrogenase family protein [Bradyrhizobium murdochi]|uniref:acyl-CoA dehydrogenase family protein n=1 Tax=Bradyrhizobium murdochi TaxID=1038859 RepID=UPI0009FF4E54|nr:acyl-CoA dehydrogenase family protein [Bradyrhizobium murdochi]